MSKVELFHRGSPLATLTSLGLIVGERFRVFLELFQSQDYFGFGSLENRPSETRKIFSDTFEQRVFEKDRLG